MLLFFVIWQSPYRFFGQNRLSETSTEFIDRVYLSLVVDPYLQTLERLLFKWRTRLYKGQLVMFSFFKLYLSKQDKC